ncbi:50S ribosomal protein L32 [candidate division FCPU426 bacterium]|nr:50S ribosomal protein L32 [candidate division FCPU426 bacterium]
MANPKRKFSKARTMKRRSSWKIPPVSISVCPQCQQPKQPHRLCPNCGYYRGKEIITPDNA